MDADTLFLNGVPRTYLAQVAALDANEVVPNEYFVYFYSHPIEVCVCVYVYIYIWVCMCEYVCICVCMVCSVSHLHHALTYTLIHSHTQHTHAHWYTQSGSMMTVLYAALAIMTAFTAISLVVSPVRVCACERGSVCVWVFMCLRERMCLVCVCGCICVWERECVLCVCVGVYLTLAIHPTLHRPLQ
jgi:hypothetical protein